MPSIGLYFYLNCYPPYSSQPEPMLRENNSVCNHNKKRAHDSISGTAAGRSPKDQYLAQAVGALPKSPSLSRRKRCRQVWLTGGGSSSDDDGSALLHSLAYLRSTPGDVTAAVAPEQVRWRRPKIQSEAAALSLS